MKKAPTKRQIRAELERQIDAYFSKGGEIAEIERGISGRENPLKAEATPIFNEPKVSRTPMPEVLGALDSRRSNKSSSIKKATKEPVEKIIYDDFGEPVRKIWVDE